MISLKDIQAARETISPFIVQTPILSSQTITKKTGNELFIKAEHLQKTGSFKIRGAARLSNSLTISMPSSLVLSHMKQLIEPSGAVAVAAALAYQELGKRIVALVSGGNVDLERIPSLLVEEN